MRKREVLLIIVDKRKESAVKMQKTLTAWGCMIKHRLGLHDGVMENCTETGLIFIELVGEQDKQIELTRKLNLLSGVTAKRIVLALENDE